MKFYCPTVIIIEIKKFQNYFLAPLKSPSQLKLFGSNEILTVLVLHNELLCQTMMKYKRKYKNYFFLVNKTLGFLYSLYHQVKSS